MNNLSEIEPATSTFHPPVPRSKSLLLFLGLVAIYCAWVLSFPVFPTQDGPVHLYYVSIFSHLLSGSQLFSHYFSIRHPIPPYSLHYLLLFLLLKASTPFIAEKCIVCLTIIGFAFGFRYLIGTIAPTYGPTVTLLAIPLSLHWSVGMGFHNYCLSLAMSFFAIAFWLRASKDRRLAYRFGFLAICAVMLFTHPVPLFMTLAFVAGDLVLKFANQAFTVRKRLWLTQAIRSLRIDLIFAAIASCSIIYIFLFVSGSRTAENLHHDLLQRDMLLDFLKLKPLILVWGNIGVRIYRILLFLLLGSALWMAIRGFRRRWRGRTFQGSDVLLIGAIALLLLYPLIPRSINGSGYFSDRLVIYIWTFAIAAASVEITLRGWQSHLFTTFACLVCIGVLGIYEGQIRRAANTLQLLENSPIRAHGTRGLLLTASSAPAEFALNFDPYLWCGAGYFRRTNTVMLNAPWLDLTILPIAARNGLFTNLFPPEIDNDPGPLTKLLSNSRQTRERISSELDYILLVGFSGKKPNAIDNVLNQDWSRAWNCDRDHWYSVCYSPDRPDTSDRGGNLDLRYERFLR